MRKRHKKKRRPKGAINKLIDLAIHPHFRRNVGLVFVDGLLHALVEQNLKESLSKFLKYNFPVLLREAYRKRRKFRESSGG